MNLFVVRTPLQYFNAVEARERFHRGEDNRLLVSYVNASDRDLIRPMLDTDWREVHWIAVNRYGSRSFGLRLNPWLRKLPAVDTLYIGLISRVPLHVANSLKPARLRLIDDGNETLRIADHIRHLRAQPVPKPPKWLDRVAGLKTTTGILQRIEAFSLYDTTPYGIPCIHNDYRMYRARSAALPERDVVVFVGSNLVGTYFRDEETFIRRLSLAAGHLAGHSLVYCPHRYEPESLRRKVADLGFELFEPGTILEQAFIRAGWRPSLLASFRSTAVDTLATIYGIPGCMFEIPAGDLIDAARNADMQAVWNDYKQRGGTVIAASDY